MSVVGRGDPVYSASPVPSTYDGRAGCNYPTNPANYPLHAGFSPQPNSSYAAQTLPMYSRGFGSDMAGGNLYHLVRPDHLQNIPTGAPLTIIVRAPTYHYCHKSTVVRFDIKLVNITETNNHQNNVKKNFKLWNILW